MFSTKEFVAASRKFVCVRLESFESKQHQDMVRKFLNGRFENTAFCILSPDGKKQLSGTGRSPQMGFGVRGRPEPGSEEEAEINQRVVVSMNKISEKFSPKGKAADAVLPDFHTLKQALNVSSGDQRLLVLTVAAKQHQSQLKKSLREVASDPELIGCFHYDAASKPDAKWADVVSGEKNKTGIFIIQPSEFGQDGKVIAELPLRSTAAQIKKQLLASNKKYSASEKRKVYSEHVAEGRRKGITYKDNMPWGEDRDADGKIDERRQGRRGRERPDCPPRGRGGRRPF